ncbi:SCO family protein [Aquimarina agarilytica]|uniref:SCO family protein n=1 Tax=Aquimarina agarilytica TaxID=1087449 RepID=UPI00028835E7|nr:SCO family protein [Aquimarina agarilytica]
MKKYSYVGISFIILLFGIIFVPRIVNRIKDTKIVSNSRMSADNKLTNEKLGYILINGQKKKIPAFALQNQDSLLITQHDYKGKVTVVDFFFVNCPTICPKMTSNLVHLQHTFKANPNFAIASFTINPKYDTPTKLKKYAEAHKVTNPYWHFLTGDRDQIYGLAKNSFNLFAEQNPNVPGGFEHSGYFALVDKQGFIRSRYDAYGNPIIYYRGTVSLEEKIADNGEEEQISILTKDIQKLLEE